MDPVGLVILAVLVTFFGGLGLAALVWGWMLPWLREHQSPRTTGLIYLGVAAFVVMSGLSDDADLPKWLADGLSNWAIAPLLLSAVAAGGLAWRDKRSADRGSSCDGHEAAGPGPAGRLP
ncbi:MAG: hypothetical protein GXX79_00860 [Actinomycetales bacterium]|nr:hypothetical protein [Actinomycetales bacterium]